MARPHSHIELPASWRSSGLTFWEYLEFFIEDPFLDSFFAECRAEARAKAYAQGHAEAAVRMLLILLDARFDMPAAVRSKVAACTDREQLEEWFDRAFTAATIGEIFGSDAIPA